MQAEAGKGSARRKNEDQAAFADNYERIFGKKKRNVDCPSGEVVDCKSSQTGSSPVSTSINKEPNEETH